MPIVAVSVIRQRRAEAQAAVLVRPDIQPRPRRRVVPPEQAVPPAVVREVAPQPEAEASPVRDEDYVGYKHPPKHTRFKKNQSGNLKGRPKGAKGMKTIAREVLTEKVSVRTPKGVKRISKVEAMLHKKAELAFAGNLRAIEGCSSLYQLAVPDELARSLQPDDAGPSAEELDPIDRATLDAYRAMFLAGDGERS